MLLLTRKSRSERVTALPTPICMNSLNYFVGEARTFLPPAPSPSHARDKARPRSIMRCFACESPSSGHGVSDQLVATCEAVVNDFDDVIDSIILYRESVATVFGQYQ